MKKFLSIMLAACLIMGSFIFDIPAAAATIRPTAVSLDKTSAALYLGDKVTLTATVTPSNTTNKSVTWASSASAIATVSSSGVVTGVASGKATITVKTVDGGKTAKCIVTVSVKNGTAKLLFEFDDGYKEDITTAAPVLKAKGFKGTAFVVKDAVMQLWGSSYMNISDVNNLYNNYGWDIGNHTVTHPHGTGTDSATLANLKNEYKIAQDWIISNGWTRGAYHADYPYGEYSDQLITILKGIGVLTGRTAFPDAIQSIPVSDFYKLACQGVQNGNVTAVKSQIDTAVSTGSTLILVTHKIQTTSGSYAISKTDFQSIVDYASQYVQQSKLNVVTISEWYNSITAQPSATVTGVNSTADINVANGTTQSNAGLPASVKITLSDGTTPAVNVTWDGGTPAYNGNAANTYVFSGTLALPSGVTNPGSLKAAVKVIVGQPTVKGVNSIADINVANGTALSSVGLPASVKITLSDGTTPTVNVTWDGGTPAYNGNAANTYVFAGTLSLPAGVTNPANLKAAVRIIVAASKPAAKLLFTFDDGYKDDITTAAPALQAKGFKGTAYVIQEGVLQLWDDTYMNLSDVNSLYNNYGWDIGNHTISHPHGTGTSSTALANLKNEYLANQQWLISNGWTRGAYHVAYPYGEYSSQLITILKGIGVLTGRTAFPNEIQPVPVSDFYQLATYALQNGNSSAVKSQIAAAVNSGSTLILMIHEIKDTNGAYIISKSEFQSVVDYAAQYVQQGKLDVTTISQWYNSVK